MMLSKINQPFRQIVGKRMTMVGGGASTALPSKNKLYTKYLKPSLPSEASLI